jgi:hypothetical protein
MASTHGQRLIFAFLLLFAFYTVGCIVFVHVERPAELERTQENRELYLKMKELYSFAHCEDPAFQRLSFCLEQKQFSESLETYFNEHGNAMVDRRQWTLLGCVFFLTHLATTIGYGDSHPRTPEGQFATIIFAIIGIPIMGYTLMQVARLNLRVSILLLRKLGAKVDSLNAQISVLWSLLAIIIFGGALVYHWLEPWTYLQSVYFCFVTLSTVGFGDFLPSSPSTQAFSIFYMIFGLGVCASIISLLTGLVAEGHSAADSFVSQNMKDKCRDCGSSMRG